MVDTGSAVLAAALFVKQKDRRGLVSPEVFPRSDGTTYACGISRESPVPVDPAEVAPDPGAIERLHDICAGLSPVFERCPVLAWQACFRPVTPDGLPRIGPISGVEGAYVATGHSVWGILNAPATGEAMTELILDGRASTLDLAVFAPGQMQPEPWSRVPRTRGSQ